MDSGTAFGPRKRNYRHLRVPCPLPPPGSPSWLKGRKQSTGVLLALHQAAVLLVQGYQTSATLYNGALARAATSDQPTWYPKMDVFFSWLIYHQIAIRLLPNLWTAHPRAREFAGLPNRFLVYRVGKLILEREGHAVGPPVARATHTTRTASVRSFRDRS